jgi:hypothetical protein
MVLTNFPHDSLLDLDPWVGQRSATFRFERWDAVSGEFLGYLNPARTAALTHDTTRTIKRQLTMTLGTFDTARINPVSERVHLFMVFPGGVEYPLGRYMYTNQANQVFTSGRIGSITLSDEMFRVDQALETGFNGTGKTAFEAIEEVLDPIDDLTLKLAGGSFLVTGSWSAGTQRGGVVESLALSGDYFSPWFGNDRAMHFVRTFDPAQSIPDFDWDEGNQILRSSLTDTSNLLTAPNRFIVISNSANAATDPAVGIYDVPSSAPHSIANRGFVIANVQNLQTPDGSHAELMARNIGIRNTIFETTTVTTAPDPRHDSYNVIHFRESNWLELGWGMALIEGGTMTHTIRKAYS